VYSSIWIGPNFHPLYDILGSQGTKTPPLLAY
jgi:hypothetical protein